MGLSHLINSVEEHLFDSMATHLGKHRPSTSGRSDLPIVTRLLEAGLRSYSLVALTERGSYRLIKGLRVLRPRDRWQDRFTLHNGIMLDLDLATYPDCCMAFGLYELTTVQLIKRLLKPGDHFVDVGANIGYFTLMAAQWVGPTGRVDAFEPEPTNYQRLIDHLALNNLIDQVHIHQMAVSDKAGQAKIYTYKGDPHFNHGTASLFPHPWGNPHDVEVTTDRLDVVLAGFHPRVIKMDVEGAEADVVVGMSHLLKADRPPAIIGEHNPSQSRYASIDPFEWVKRVLTIQPRYCVYIVGTKLKRVEPTPSAFERLGQLNLLLTIDRK